MMEGIITPVDVSGCLIHFLLLGVGLGLALATYFTKRIPPLLLVIFSLAFFTYSGIFTGNTVGVIALAGIPVLLFVIIPLAASLIYILPERLLEEPPDEKAKTLRNHPTLKARSDELENLGFRPAGDYFTWSPGEKQVARCFLDESRTTLARIVVTHSGTHGIMLCSESGDRHLETTTWLSMTPWPLPPGTVEFYHHFCDCLDDLAECHHRHRDEEGMILLSPIPPDEIFAREQAGHLAEMQEAAKHGYLHHIPGKGYRLTFTGGVRASLKSILNQYKRHSYRLGSR